MIQVVLQLVDLPIQVVPQRQSLVRPQKADYSTPNPYLQKEVNPEAMSVGPVSPVEF